MYTTTDEEFFLSPESIISGVLANDLIDDPTDDLEFEVTSFEEIDEGY